MRTAQMQPAGNSRKNIVSSQRKLVRSDGHTPRVLKPPLLLFSDEKREKYIACYVLQNRQHLPLDSIVSK